MAYDTEQGGEYDHDATRMDEDLKPWLRREWDLDLFLTEFPYHQYAGTDFDPSEDEKTRDWMEKDWTDDDPSGWSDHIKQKGPYRTDLVGIRVDRRALRTRIQRLGHHTPLNQSGQGKRRYRRTYLTFAGDGPMTRNYWETEHGGPDELRSYGEDSARRARVFADYRWTAMDADAADLALANADAFRNAGVGLLTVHPEDGVQVHVWAERCTPEVDRDLLDRYMVERWDVNERALMELERAYEWEPPEDPDSEFHPVEPGAPDILGELDLDSVETEAEPPTVNGHTAAFASGQRSTSEDPNHKPLTAFTGDGETGA